MRTPHFCAICLVVLALHLSGCETVQSFFPDKQKDYRYSVEIPPLELPPDLKSDAIKLQDNMHSSAATVQAVEVPPGETAPAASATPLKAAATPQQSLISWTEGSTRLQINEGFEKAWLIVSKALTHKAVEITDRDRSQGVFFVQYDPEEYQIVDGSLWDEVAFFFGARDSHEQPYRVRVLASGEHSEVAVTDERDVLVVQEPGLSLLKLLYESIKTDAEEKIKPAAEEPKKTEPEAQQAEQPQPEPEPSQPAAAQ